MASLQCRKGSFRVVFRYHGKQLGFTIGKVSTGEAEAKAAQVDYLLMRLKQQLVTLPSGVDIVEFVQFDGKGRPTPTLPPATKLTLAELRDRYLATRADSLETSTLGTIRMHFRHLVACFGEAYSIADLSPLELQQYVGMRAKAEGIYGRKLSAVTIQKEVVSLRTAWNWGIAMKLLTESFPGAGVSYPKTTEKPVFQTLAEIERQTKDGGLTEAEKNDLYDALYLEVNETAQPLTHVKTVAFHGFIYPMFCMAAHTGARRSELLRMKVADVDLPGKTVTIRERKRRPGEKSTRRVPMSGFLVGVIEPWLSDHPGGPWLFCHEPTVAPSKKRSPTTGHRGEKEGPSGRQRSAGVRRRDTAAASALTKDEANHHFKKVLAGSRWAVLRGWHVLRHSFVSACASRGVDKRYVESWAGHMSPEMSRRYAHLYPSSQQEALSSVFDQVA